MLFLDYTQVKYCKLQDKDKTISGIIYNGNVFVREKGFPKEELEVAIKECREEYLDHVERCKILTLLVQEKNTVGIWMQNNNYQPHEILSTSNNKQSAKTQSSSDDRVKPKTDKSRISIRQLAAKMRSETGVEIKTRRRKLKFYHRCFLGTEAVDWIIKQTQVSRQDAVSLGQKMVDKGIFHHVLDEHQFQDEDLFYRFNDDEGKSIWNSNI